ncbi:ABC transporter ATP-binding protein [Nostocoides sp. HKS02]|uniref:ABC transporter ATP-binding protein n=1 Tax=Nostocoides sp. HKS02 TaxID=1813880 RepID=UPI0012B45408|nr:ABC transporter ATP-binding protein [Tetrasphaera sp. HKS02]QGN58466.1 ATP-binding cassette domain-containing protein [Tetrasphaera sp. HKS02]
MTIEVQGVRRAFGDVLAVDSISLTARPGEVTALIGPNGSGKTTLLLMLATLLVPDQGTIRVAGLDPVTQHAQVRAQIGWMPDGFGTWDALTVREVLHTVAAAYRMPADRARARTDELLHTVHLADLADRRARVLSRGQKQRLGLARALINDPHVLLLDEPASGLDPRSRIELRDVLRSLAAQGKTILVSSHILTELQEVADRAVIVARGRTIETQNLDADFVSTASASWRIDSLDGDRLATWLAEHHVPATRVGGGLTEVEVAGEENAARLLADLVRDGIRITAFGPSQGALESAYLAATQDRR